MSRPLRLEFPGSLWHITARGNERKDIFADDFDRRFFLELLGACVDRFEWILPSYVLMGNHYHLVIQLTAATLSRGMQWLNSGYGRAFNRRHDRVGHLFQGRFKGFLVDKETYYLEVLRYVVLNPVRAGIVTRAEDYVWSSYRAILGEGSAPEWLAVDDVLVQFGPTRETARARYREFVAAGIGAERKLWDDLAGQMYLGSEAWLERMRNEVALKPRADEHPRSHRMVREPSMAEIIAAVAESLSTDEDRLRLGHGGIPRMVAAWIGCREARLPNRTIAAALRLDSASHVSELVRGCDRALSRDLLLRGCVDRCVATMGRKNRQPQT